MTPVRGARPGRDHPVVLAVVTFVAYVALAAWAEEFAVTRDAKLSIWYPPPGLLLVVVHLRGLRYWAVGFLAEVAVSVWVYDVAEDFGVARVVLNAAAVTGAYAAGALLLRAGRVRPGFGRRYDLAWFVVASFLVAAPLAALAGTAVQRWAGYEQENGFARAVANWWLGDAVGIVVLAPVGYALAGAAGPALAWIRRNRDRVGGFEVGEALAVIGVPVAVFAFADDPYRVLYVVLLPVVLVAVRQGSGPAAFAVLGSVLAATIAADQGEGGTVGRTDLQLLLLVLAMTGNAIGVLEQLRRQFLAQARQLTALLEASPDVVAIVDADSRVQWVNPAGRRLLELPDGVPGGRDTAAEGVVLQGALDDGAVSAALQQGSWRGSARLRRPDGELRLSQLVVALPDEHGSRAGIVARDVTDLHRVADQLTRLAFEDELTGLANRARLLERLGFALGRSEPHTARHGLVLLDIDRFSALNDHRGHDVGDAVLRRVADRLADVVRAGELLARVGGDRFAVLLEDVDDEFTAVAVAERLRLAACTPDEPATDGSLAAESAALAVSAGVVVGASGDDPDVVLRQADLALQRAKQAGGAMTSPYDRSLSDRLAKWSMIEALVRDAVASDGWPVRYQPVVELTTGAVVGCEALLEPLAPPLEVIEVAEEVGLIARLGEQVLATAATQAVAWRRLVPGLRMGVNVSAHQLVDPQLPDRVAEVLAAAGLPGDALVLEVTETAFTDDHPQTVAAATLLQNMGVRIAIDDFGTGFSSLGRLRSLPADELKLDRTFVADLGQLPGAEAIVAAVVALGAARGLHVIAEGVELESQRQALLELGCAMGQGWLFAYPMAPGEFDRWLDARLGTSARPAGA